MFERKLLLHQNCVHFIDEVEKGCMRLWQQEECEMKAYKPLWEIFFALAGIFNVCFE